MGAGHPQCVSTAQTRCQKLSYYRGTPLWLVPLTTCPGSKCPHEHHIPPCLTEVWYAPAGVSVCVCVKEGRVEIGHLLYVCVGSQICSKTNSYPTEPCCPGNGFDSKFITILSSSENWTSNTTYQEYSRPMNMVCFKSLKNIHNQVWLGLKWRSNTTTSINMSFCSWNWAEQIEDWFSSAHAGVRWRLSPPPPSSGLGTRLKGRVRLGV